MSQPQSEQTTGGDDVFAKLLGKIISSCRFPLDNEKATQAYISQTLTGFAIDHIREQRLKQGDRVDIVDFWLPSSSDMGAIIEVKMNSAKSNDVLRQLTRYAEHPKVRAIFLVSNKAMNLPHEINGKPLHFFSLGRAWL